MDKLLIPYFVIRFASDDAGDKAIMKWEISLQMTIANSTSIIEDILETLNTENNFLL